MKILKAYIVEFDVDHKDDYMDRLVVEEALSHAICEGLASPLYPSWKDKIEWKDNEVKMLE